ncbi:hypothetical protein Acr_03g0012430 [Actinidia rufa]|uniref:RING-type E3 ubiquitin transferase n=1 Tax=Actinidia rufa TaxID=165716 RepID=A0A7J0EF35_9ERIC|nr:hypothetical protein Acr_03g0012430 [Actinidia rufa]
MNLDKEPSAPPGNASRARAPGENFDINMLIILAALLCALIFALGLNSIVRCAIRCSRNLAFESSTRLATRGLKRSVLHQIPVAVYGSGANNPATDCAICLDEFADGEIVRVLPKCRHGFHVKCIDMWLTSHASCPTCRRSLVEQPTPFDAAEVEIGFGHHLGNA